MLELVAVLPLLFLLVAGVVDVGSVLSMYIELSRVVYEGVRLETRLSNITVGDFQGLTPGQNCSPSATTSPQHALVQRRVVRLLQLSSGGLSLNNVCVQTGRVAPPAADPRHNNTVYTRLQATYDGYFPLFSGIPIQVEAREAVVL